MKSQIMLAIAILGLSATLVPASKADNNSDTTKTEQFDPKASVHQSMIAERAPTTEVSEDPIYIETLKTDNIIEKNKRHNLISGVKHGELP